MPHRDTLTAGEKFTLTKFIDASLQADIFC